MKTNDMVVKSLIEVVDNLAELRFFLEKIDLLADEISSDYFDKLDFKSERGRMIAEYERDIARVKAEIVCDYIAQVSAITEKSLELSNSVLKKLTD